MGRTKFKTVDEYIAAAPKHTRSLLKEMRKIIKQTAPQAEEAISYNIPAFKFHGGLAWYAAYEEHIGFYPGASPIKSFKDDLVKYKSSKGGIQFPIGKGIPVALVKKIVKYIVKENLERAKAKEKK